MTKGMLFPMFSVLTFLVLSDLHSRRVPLRFIGIGFALRSVLFFTEGTGWTAFLAAVLKGMPALIGGLFLVLLFDRLFGRKTLGGGDLWFIALLLFSFPFGTALPGILIGLAAGLLPLLMGRIRRKKHLTIPLTPYLMIGLELSILFGG
jgi:Flp pilus assembly protein protease CpaA